jgi:hypothetical protein
MTALAPIAFDTPNAGEKELMKLVDNEDLMFDRHRRLRKLPEITYEFTKDPGLLQQYYSLRGLVFSRTHGIDMPGIADSYDEKSEIIIAKLGDQVIGGTRLTFIKAGDDPSVSLNKYSIHLEKDMPELSLNKIGFCDASKMVILEEFQTRDIMKNLIDIMFRRCNEKGFKYAFSMCPTIVYRLYRLTINRLGYHSELCEKIRFPDNVDGVSGSTFKLMMFDIEKSFSISGNKKLEELVNKPAEKSLTTVF